MFLLFIFLSFYSKHITKKKKFFNRDTIIIKQITTQFGKAFSSLLLVPHSPSRTHKNPWDRMAINGQQKFYMYCYILLYCYIKYIYNFYWPSIILNN